MRINRILSLAGFTSRRKADEWIRSGRVSVNGLAVSEPGVKAVWGSDEILVDGKEIQKPAPRLYLMLNKPFGYISTMDDPQGRPLANDLLKTVPARVYPVGRLDFDSLGLLLFTNDGEWAYRLTHPRYGVPRIYKVTLAGMITDEAVAAMQKGVPIDDESTVKALVTVLSRREDRTYLRMTIREGKSRQVRRMCEAVGFAVIHLIRTGFGTLRLGDLKVSEYRFLSPEEVRSMKQLVKLS
jgi:23S rRNA pseudouridine2605 synthase